MDASWKQLQADASNNLLPPALNILEEEAQVGWDWGLGDREIMFVLASGTFIVIWSYLKVSLVLCESPRRSHGALPGAGKQLVVSDWLN